MANSTSYLNRQNYLEKNQQEAIDPDQIENRAGGYVWKIDEWGQLRRFLTLGTEGGTYYASEQEMTRENVRNLEACIQADGVKTAKTIQEMRDRVPKRDPIIYALALTHTLGNREAKAYVESIFNEIIRTGSDILQFAAFVDGMRGWGRSLSRLVGSWYKHHLAEDSLDYQVLKYQNRHNWTHRDVMRKAHLTADEFNNATIRWVIGAELGKRTVRRNVKDISTIYDDTGELPKLLAGYEEIKRADNVKDVIRLIENNRFTHEMVPNQWKNDPDVWMALLQNMPAWALTRNLAKMSSIELLKPFSDATKLVLEKLTAENIVRAKMHPIQLLMACLTYAAGHGTRGSLTWEPVSSIVDALEAGFYHAFGSIEPSNKHTLIGLDVSGSMTSGEIAGCIGLTPRIAAAVMAMVTIRTEPYYQIMAFTDTFIELNFAKNETLASVVHKTANLSFGRTDCSLPILYAMGKELDVETFIVYTDNETYAGRQHPAKALKDFRQRRVQDARSIVVGMTATNCSIADPNDPGMLDVVGFDTATPQLISDFAKGNI